MCAPLCSLAGDHHFERLNAFGCCDEVTGSWRGVTDAIVESLFMSLSLSFTCVFNAFILIQTVLDGMCTEWEVLCVQQLQCSLLFTSFHVGHVMIFPLYSVVYGFDLFFRFSSPLCVYAAWLRLALAIQRLAV